jgi:hypothetical protein
MRPNIVLIDFENVQPESLNVLEGDHFRVLVFVGANQAKVSFETAAALQRLGARAQYIRIAGNGSNALDFHIAYYIGELAAADPMAYFHIVSKDTGFDPLIAHLKSKKILAGRVRDVTDIPIVKAPTKKIATERAELFLEKLAQPKVTKPRSLKTLSNAIASFFQKQVSEDEVAAVVDGMVKTGAISLDGEKVKYAAENNTGQPTKGPNGEPSKVALG